MAVKKAEVAAAASRAEQASDLERWVRQARAQARQRARAAAAPSQRVVVVTGGKGGVGKSNFSLNFSLALQERGRRVLLVDCDSGLGNLDVLLGICPSRHLGQVLSGECNVQEAVVPGPLGLQLLPAASGIEAIGRATAVEVGRLIRALTPLAETSDLCVLDSGAGLGPQIRALLRAAGEIMVVTTPEPTALADAYATVKAIHRDNARATAALVVNMADNARDADAAAGSVMTVCRRFLDWTPRYLGYVPRDPAVGRAVRQQRPFLLTPGSSAARAIRDLAAAFCDEEPGSAPRRAGLKELLLTLVRPRSDEGWGIEFGVPAATSKGGAAL